ncbi:MAG: hypothetical protein HUK17_01975 [Bacteroidales bacterium]|nr:hypothetical protein [Bacteroidales bacterium]
MKHNALFLILTLIASMGYAQDRAFEDFAAHFGSSAAFAYTQVGGREVLLVSHEVFGTDDSLHAIAASLFALDSDGKIVSLGSIRSQGTLYPVSLIEGQLLVAGHRFVSLYSLRGDEPDLVLTHHEEGDSESPQLSQWFATFEKAQAILFHRK